MQFKEIIGQTRAKTTFFNSIRENRLAHALILKGGPGVGKLAFANAIAQYVNCENPSENDSCGSCAACVKIRKGIHPDIHYILPIISSTTDGKKATTDDFFPQFREKFFQAPYFSLKEWVTVLDGENKQVGIHIAEIRELKRKITLKAFEARYKVVIIWNAEKINNEAANAMLKVLEEPPERTLFILTVSDSTQLLTTINSRCQRLMMHRVGEAEIQTWLQKEFALSADHAMQIALLAEGSVSRAVELVNETNKSLSELYRAWLRICLKGDYTEISQWTEGLARENKEFQKLYLSYALQKLRDSLLFSFQAEKLASAPPDEVEFQKKFSKFIHLNGIEGLTRMLEDSLFYVSRNANATMVFSVLSLRVHALLNGKVLI